MKKATKCVVCNDSLNIKQSGDYEFHQGLCRILIEFGAFSKDGFALTDKVKKRFKHLFE